MLNPFNGTVDLTLNCFEVLGLPRDENYKHTNCTEKNCVMGFIRRWMPEMAWCPICLWHTYNEDRSND